MIKKTITWTDYDDVEHTEDRYFNLSKAELTKMDYLAEDGLANYITNIVNTNDKEKMFTLVEDLIIKSYGKKTPDGVHFYKPTNEELQYFKYSPEYSALFMDIVDSEESFLAFVRGILPKDLAEKVNL